MQVHSLPSHISGIHRNLGQLADNNMVATCFPQHVGDKLSGDWSSGFVLLILSRIGEMRNDGCDSSGRGNLQRMGQLANDDLLDRDTYLASMNHDTKFHQVGVHGPRTLTTPSVHYSLNVCIYIPANPSKSPLTVFKMYTSQSRTLSTIVTLVSPEGGWLMLARARGILSLITVNERQHSIAESRAKEKNVPLGDESSKLRVRGTCFLISDRGTNITVFVIPEKSLIVEYAADAILRGCFRMRPVRGDGGTEGVLEGGSLDMSDI